MFLFSAFSRDNETNGTVKYDILFSKTSWDGFICVHFQV